MGALPINCSRVSRLVPHTYTKDGRRILSPNQGGGPPDLLWLGVTQASPNSGMRTWFLNENIVSNQQAEFFFRFSFQLSPATFPPPFSVFLLFADTVGSVISMQRLNFGRRSLLLGILGSYFNTLTQHQAKCMQTQGKSRILMFS